MKIALFLFIFITSCSAIVNAEEKKPSGKELFSILLKNLNNSLKDENHCNVEQNNLSEYFSDFLSMSYANKNLVNLKSSCSRSKHKFKNSVVVNVWDCQISILEENAKKEFISSSSITFSIDLKKVKIIQNSLRCL